MEETNDGQLDNRTNNTGSFHHRYLNNMDEAVLDTPNETNTEDTTIEEEDDDIPGLSLSDDGAFIDSNDSDGSEGSKDNNLAEAAEKAAIEAAKSAENAGE